MWSVVVLSLHIEQAQSDIITARMNSLGVPVVEDRYVPVFSPCSLISLSSCVCGFSELQYVALRPFAPVACVFFMCILHGFTLKNKVHVHFARHPV